MSGIKFHVKNKKFSLKPLIHIGLITLGVFLVYFRVTDAPFILDDFPKIIHNQDIRSLSNIPDRLLYPYSEYGAASRNDPSRPITYLTYTLNYHFSALNPKGYHRTDILIHILNSILFYSIFLMLFKAFCAESAYAGGLTAGLLYALHPAMTNTVSYVFARSGQLSALFLFLSFFLFLKSDNQKNKGLVFYLFSLLSFILALFSKQSAASFPALILLYLLLANSTTNLKRSLKKSFPYFCVLGLWLLFRYISFGAIGDIEGTGMLWNRIDYILIQPLVYLNYLWLIIFPAGISFEHSLLPLNGLGDPLFFIPLIYIAGMIICFIIFLRNLSVQDRKILLFSLGFFILFILPTSSVFPTTAPLEEKRLYFSSAGFFIAAGWALQRFVSGDFYKNFSVKPILRFLFLTYFIFLGLSTMGRNEYFREPEMVWKDVICKYPGHSRAHNNLGSLYLNRGNSLMAAQSLFSALATDSESPAAHANLGILYERYLNDLPSAEKCYQKAVELDRMPVFPLIRLGNMYFANGDDRSALNYYDMALKYDAFSDEAYIYKGYLYLARGELESAAEAYEKALQINPRSSEALNNLGVIYTDTGELEKAKDFFIKASSLANNKDADLNLELLMQMKSPAFESVTPSGL